MPSYDLSDNQIYQQLRDAIDNGQDDEINRIFNEYPDLDWNVVTQNGLSALWWALTPPHGQAINVNIIKLLLHLERDHRRVINPSQQYADLRPDYYLRQFISGDNTPKLQKLIQKAQETFIDQYRNTIVEQNDINHQLATDTHNASNAFIVRASDENLKRLYARYHKKLVVEDEIKDIERFIETPNFQKSFPLSLQKEEILKALNQIKVDSTERSAMTSKLGPCYLKEALALTWLAAKDTQTDVVPDPNPDGRQKVVLTNLFDIQTTYGRNSPSCWQGKWGRIGTALSNMHNDVHYQSDEPLTGELARNKCATLIGIALNKLYEDESKRATYWSVLNTRLILGMQEEDEENKDIKEKNRSSAESWWKETMPSIKIAMRESNVEKGEIDSILNAVNVYSIPLSRHEPSRQIQMLQRLFQQKADSFVLPSNKSDINKAIESLKSDFINTCLRIPDDISLDKDKINQINEWILNTLLARANEDEEIEITNLWKVVKTQLKIDKLNNHLLSDWYKTLELNKKIEIANDCIEKNSLSSSDLIQLAWKYYCIAGLSLKEMNLAKCDLRGWDLSGIDFNKTDLRNADLRLITASGTAWEGCNLAGATFNQFIFPEALVGSIHCTEEFLSSQDSKGNTPLQMQVLASSSKGIKLIIESKHCTEKVLAIPNENNETVLHLCVKKMIDPYDRLIIRSVYPGYVKSITELPQCTPEVLATQNKDGKTALHLAIDSKYMDVMQPILDSPCCNEEVLSTQDINGKTVLHTAIERGYLKLAQSLLDLPHCKGKIFFAQDADGKTVLQKALDEGYKDIAQLLTKKQNKYFLLHLKSLLNQITTREEILDLFKKMKEKNGEYAYIHEYRHPKLCRFRLFFKRATNGENNFLHTETYQKAVKMLKNSYIDKKNAYQKVCSTRIEEEKYFINYYRSNAPAHLLPTATSRKKL